MANYRITQLDELAAVPCPCGTSRRAFTDVPSGVASVHLLDVSSDARTHYHRQLIAAKPQPKTGPFRQGSWRRGEPPSSSRDEPGGAVLLEPPALAVPKLGAGTGETEGRRAAKILGTGGSPRST